MDEKEENILRAAYELAKEHGFEGVRQREVAAKAGVALGTLYSRFSGKDELFVGAIELETRKLEEELQKSPPKGRTAVDRAEEYFRLATHYFTRHPNFGRAVLRGITSGEPTLSGRIMKFQARQLDLVVAVMMKREPGAPPKVGRPKNDLDENEATILGTILLQLWFTALVAWSQGLIGEAGVHANIRGAADLLAAGLDARRSDEPR